MKLPSLRALRQLFIDLKAHIGDEYRAEGCEDDSFPSMTVTVGWDPGSPCFGWQTGDNSFTGGAYGYRHWAVVTLDRRSNSLDLAREVRDQLADLEAS